MTQSQLTPEEIKARFNIDIKMTGKEIEKLILLLEEEISQDLAKLDTELLDWEKEQCWSRAKRLSLCIEEAQKKLPDDQEMRALSQEMIDAVGKISQENIQTPLINPVGKEVEMTERYCHWMHEFYHQQQYFKDDVELAMARESIQSYFGNEDQALFCLSRYRYLIAKAMLAMVNGQGTPL